MGKINQGSEEGRHYIARRRFMEKRPYSLLVGYQPKENKCRVSKEWHPSHGWLRRSPAYNDELYARGVYVMRSNSIDEIFNFILYEAKVLGSLKEMEEYLESIPDSLYADYLIRKHIINDPQDNQS